MTDKEIKSLYEEFCFDKINCTYDRWAQLIKKFPDDDVKQAFIRKDIDCYSSLENALVDTLSDEEQPIYYGYKNLDDMKRQIKVKLDELKKR